LHLFSYNPPIPLRQRGRFLQDIMVGAGR